MSPPVTYRPAYIGLFASLVLAVACNAYLDIQYGAFGIEVMVWSAIYFFTLRVAWKQGGQVNRSRSPAAKSLDHRRRAGHFSAVPPDVEPAARRPVCPGGHAGIDELRHRRSQKVHDGLDGLGGHGDVRHHAHARRLDHGVLSGALPVCCRIYARGRAGKPARAGGATGRGRPEHHRRPGRVDHCGDRDPAGRGAGTVCGNSASHLAFVEMEIRPAKQYRAILHGTEKGADGGILELGGAGGGAEDSKRSAGADGRGPGGDQDLANGEANGPSGDGYRESAGQRFGWPTPNGNARGLPAQGHAGLAGDDDYQARPMRWSNSTRWSSR